MHNFKLLKCNDIAINNMREREREREGGGGGAERDREE